MKRWIITFHGLVGTGQSWRHAQQTVQDTAARTARTEPRETTLKSGLKYLDLVVGGGREIAGGDSVDVQYSGLDLRRNGKRGKLFDTSIGGRLLPSHRPDACELGRRSRRHEIGGKRKLIIRPDSELRTPQVRSGRAARLFVQIRYSSMKSSCFGYSRTTRPGRAMCSARGVSTIGFDRKAARGPPEDRQLGCPDRWRRQDVRSDCSIPYRWEKLFIALVRWTSLP